MSRREIIKAIETARAAGLQIPKLLELLLLLTTGTPDDS